MMDAGRRQRGTTVQGVFFDLDYTLYDQSRYLVGALAAVASLVAAESGADRNGLAASLLGVWRTVGTGDPHLFDRWLEHHDLRTADRVARCVGTFHAHRPARLPMYPGADDVLEELKSSYYVGIVTDGYADMQRAKVKALGLAGRVHTIVCSADLSRRKPDPEIFHHALRVAGIAPRSAVFVGDHPVRDILGARQVGMWAIRMLTGEFRNLPDDPIAGPYCRLRSIRELPAVLATLSAIDAGHRRREALLAR